MDNLYIFFTTKTGIINIVYKRILEALLWSNNFYLYLQNAYNKKRKEKKKVNGTLKWLTKCKIGPRIVHCRITLKLSFSHPNPTLNAIRNRYQCVALVRGGQVNNKLKLNQLYFYINIVLKYKYNLLLKNKIQLSSLTKIIN